MDDLGTLEIVINSTNTDTQKLNTLKSALRGLGREAANLDLSNAIKQLESLSVAIDNISMDKISNISTALKGLKSVKVSTPKVSSTPAKELTDSATNTVTYINGKLAGTTPLQNFMQDWLPSLSETQLELQKMYPTAMLAAKGIYELGRAGTTPLRGMQKQITKLTSGLGRMFSAIKRIALYRIIRTLLKNITQGFKEGIENLYKYSNALGGRFAQSMDTVSTSLLYLKNSLGAMASPIINSLAPAIDALIDRFVVLLNLINQFFAKLSGADTYTRAVKQTTKYSEATAGAAKALKTFTTGFDELNVISENLGGGSGASADVSKMFEDVAISEQFDFVDSMIKAINQGDWKGAGKVLANKLNSLVSGWDSYSFGKKLGTKINNGVDFAFGFLSTFDFTNAGATVAKLLNGIIETVDFRTIGLTLSRGLTGAFDFAIGFITTFNWRAFGSAVKNLLVGSFDGIANWAKEINWFEFGSTLYNSIKETLLGLDIGAIAESFWHFAGVTFGSLIGILGGFISEAFADIYSYFGEKVEESGGDISSGILKGILEGLTNFVSWIGENIYLPFYMGIAEAFGLDKGATGNIYVIGTEIIKALLRGLRGEIPNLDTALNAEQQNILRKLLNGIKQFINDVIRQINNFADMVNPILEPLALAGVDVPTIPKLNYLPIDHARSFASGGTFRREGQLFIANEKAPELVGNFGSNSAVMNNDQIVTAVSQGVYNAVMAAMSNSDNDINLTVTVPLDGVDIYKNQQKVARTRGYNFDMGAFAR